MVEMDSALLKEAFIEPIRFALLLDDKFPIYSILATGAFSADLDNERAQALFNLCRGKGWLCDVDSRGATAQKFEEEKHLHQSDLLILDFNLDPLDQDDPTIALKILQRLSASDHFNLVIVYTYADPNSVRRDIAFSLGAGRNPLEEVSVEARDSYENMDEKDADAVNQAMSWAVVDDFLRGETPRGSANDIRQRLTEGGIDRRAQTGLVKQLAYERMRARVKPEVVAARIEDRAVYSSVSAAGVHWITQGNLFAVVVNKDERPEVLVDRLVEALEAWNPRPLLVMMMHARSALEKAGALYDHKVLETPRLQAGWFLRVMLARDAQERRQTVEDLYDRLFERLARKAQPSILEFGLRIVEPVATVEPIAAARALARVEASLTDEQIYHALNEFVSSVDCSDGPMTTGVLLRADRHGSNHYWVCISPACDLIPGQNRKGWDHDLRPMRPISLARLKLVRSTPALRDATIGRHLYLSVDDSALAFEVAEGNTRQMEIEIAILESDGIIVDSRVKGHLIGITSDGRPTFDILDFEIIGRLRPDYANRLLSLSGQQRSRIGVDFFNLPGASEATA